MAGLPPKLADQFAYPPRLMRLGRVASYVDVSPSTFLRMVEEGVMPKPITHKGIRWWDRNDIEACCDDLKEGPINTYDKVMGLK
jgi:predicted DNA-binding transcriptional regulator AlpA